MYRDPYKHLSDFMLEKHLLNTLRVKELPKSAEECLNEAIYYESLCNDIGAHDPSFIFFREKQRCLEAAAALIERKTSNKEK